MVKILVMLRDIRSGSGVASCIMNYYKYLPDHMYQVDFILERWVDSPYSELVKNKKSQVFILPHDTGKPNFQNVKFMASILNNNQYDAVHVNTTGLNALNILALSQKINVKSRIYHAHAPIVFTSLKVRFRYFLYEKPTVFFANKYVACSNSVGKSVFKGRNVFILPNAFEIQRYAFDYDARKQIRSDLKIDDRWVMGIVSRMSDEKNPFLVIDIFKEVKSRQQNAVLLWAGDGPLKGQIVQHAEKLGVRESCVFVGARKDVNSFYSAMDVFCLPSKYEGLGLVFLEAQIAGLPCYGSEGVPCDVDISENMHHIELNKGPGYWAEEILKSVLDCQNRMDSIKKCNGIEMFDILKAQKKLIALYDKNKKDVV